MSIRRVGTLMQGLTHMEPGVDRLGFTETYRDMAYSGHTLMFCLLEMGKPCLLVLLGVWLVPPGSGLSLFRLFIMPLLGELCTLLLLVVYLLLIGPGLLLLKLLSLLIILLDVLFCSSSLNFNIVLLLYQRSLIIFPTS